MNFATALFIAGLANACGPCNTQRMLSLAACTTYRKRRTTTIIFTAGVFCSTIVLLMSTGLLGHFVAASAITNAIIATMCITWGIVGIWNAEAQDCTTHRSDHGITAIGTFTLGCASSCLIAPCCAPFLIFIVAYAPDHLLAIDAIAYASGTAFPYLLAGLFARSVLPHINTPSSRQAIRVVGSTLSLTLGILSLAEIA